MARESGGRKNSVKRGGTMAYDGATAGLSLIQRRKNQKQSAMSEYSRKERTYNLQSMKGGVVTEKIGSKASSKREKI